jgi:endonuclease/exonuclease/phosphatase family metal-dependent hydrolase
MTFNIRVNVSADSLDAWPHRKDMAASMIRFHGADIVGTQEALDSQRQDLAERLPDHAWAGVGRDDGSRNGEYAAIFYRKDRFDCEKNATFWLSENPDKPGPGWDAACPRIVTWCRFRDKATGKPFFVFNTHFDHIGRTARKESALLLLSRIEEIAKGNPVVVTGDFNSTPESEPYRILVKDLEGLPGSKLVDTRTVSQIPHHGPSFSFTGFKPWEEGPWQQVDYVFVKNHVTVLRHGTLSDAIDGHFPSDHMPVLAEVVIE